MDQPKQFEIKKRRLIEIIRSKSYREGDFTLASGKKSTFYIDLKNTTLDPEGITLIAELAVEVLSQLSVEISAVGGLTLGADPLATAISMKAFEKGQRWPAYIVRKEVKDHGTGKAVEGRENMRPGSSPIVLEDVVTTGGSGLKAVERLREAGFLPKFVLTVVDRQAGGEKVFADAGLRLLTLVRLDEIQNFK